MHSLLDPSVSWDDLAWLRSLTDLPMVLKGVMRGDDAARAADEGIEGIIGETEIREDRCLGAEIDNLDPILEVAVLVGEGHGVGGHDFIEESLGDRLARREDADQDSAERNQACSLMMRHEPDSP